MRKESDKERRAIAQTAMIMTHFLTHPNTSILSSKDDGANIYVYIYM